MGKLNPVIYIKKRQMHHDKDGFVPEVCLI